MKRSRKYTEAKKRHDDRRAIPLQEAIELAKEIAYASFDESLDIALRLNIKKSQSVRSVFSLPHSFGKATRVLVFAKGEKIGEAQEAGSDYAGGDELIEKIKTGWFDFDVAVSTPDMMAKVGTLGPLLGRRGLMPNPKAQTVTMDIAQTVKALKKGRVEFRADKTGVVHLRVGKLSMDSAKLHENAKEFIREVTRQRPADAKGEFVQSIAISSTMGPGIRVDPKSEDL